MKFKNILITLVVIFVFLGLFIYIEPSITGLVVQDRFLVSDIKVSADKFDQEVKVEQFDEHEIKIDNAIYYFTAELEREQKINYILIEFMVDSSQIRDYIKEDVNLYLYKDGWLELETEFIKQDGRFYYYKAKSEEFGLFAVAPREKEEIFIPIGKTDLIIFALLPIFILILLFSGLSYGFVRTIQKINYRFYLLFKKLFVVLAKFGLSLGIVVLVLSILSPEQGPVEKINLIYYAVIPLLVLGLFSNLVLNLFLKLHRLVKYTRTYRVFRNSLWLFVPSLIIVISLLTKFVPSLEGTVTRFELIIYGLLPLIFILGFVVFSIYIIYKLVRKVVIRT